MKKIYMRLGASPIESITPLDVLNSNIIGGNSGNLFYQYSMVKALSTNNVEIIPSRYKTNICDVDNINAECSAFVIPLADAFRKDFISELRALTNMIKKLTIPCIVTGVGLRADYEPDFTTGFSFDNDVKEFVKAVLDKSAMIGLRGEITGKYLNKLGFKEEKDFTIIGCPSLYMNGVNLNTRIKKIDENSTVCYNSSLYSDENVKGLIKEIEKSFSKNYFIMQELKELRLLYSGLPFEADEEYPCKKMSDGCYLENKARFFINVPSWIEFIKEADLSIGTRFHGNVASILAGTQTLFIPHDARTRELIEYHGLPNINKNMIKKGDKVLDLLEKVDFESHLKYQEKNFEHFKDFLDINGLDNIYRNENNISISEKFFESKMKHTKISPAIECIVANDVSTIVSRTDSEMKRLMNISDRYKSYNQLLNKWFVLKNNNVSLARYFQMFNISNIVIYGAGELGKRLYEDIVQSNIDIKYAIDKANNTFYNMEVKSLKESSFENIDAIIITPIFEYKSIAKKIRDDVKKISLQTIVDFLYESNKS